MKNNILPQKKSIHIIFAILLVLGCADAAYRIYTIRTKPAHLLSQITQLKKQWADDIHTSGGKLAYEHFKTASKAYGIPQRHSLAHLFSQLLYEKYGIEAINICDSDIEYACFHTIVAQEVIKSGLSQLPVIEKICDTYDARGIRECTHGIGHGVYEVAGYQGLNSALTACTRLTTENHRLSCASGVYMEYFGQITNNPTYDILFMRRYNPSKPYDTCDSVPSEYRRMCYIKLVHWWFFVLPQNTKYQKMGQLCSAVTDKATNVWCFRTIGNMSVWDDKTDTKEVIRLCNLMPSREKNVYCRGGAAENWFVYYHDFKKNTDVCSDLTPTDMDMCKHLSTYYPLYDPGADINL